MKEKLKNMSKIWEEESCGEKEVCMASFIAVYSYSILRRPKPQASKSHTFLAQSQGRKYSQ
jgi:hypothetical protein